MPLFLPQSRCHPHLAAAAVEPWHPACKEEVGGSWWKLEEAGQSHMMMGPKWGVRTHALKHTAHAHMTCTGVLGWWCVTAAQAVTAMLMQERNMYQAPMGSSTWVSGGMAFLQHAWPRSLLPHITPNGCSPSSKQHHGIDDHL